MSSLLLLAFIVLIATSCTQLWWLAASEVSYIPSLRRSVGMNELRGVVRWSLSGAPHTELELGQPDRPEPVDHVSPAALVLAPEL